MTKPSDFILTTDYATLKNDTDNIVQITVPANVVIPANSFLQFTADITAAQPGAIVQTQVGDSFMGQVLVGNQVVFHHDTFDPYDVFCLVYRPNALTLRCVVYLPNPYGTPTTGINQAVTYTFYVDTYLPPF